ncbi:MAG TPA: hypothetical protein VM737_02450 [Gemmatimonadota bacterium]|nr:hypothetical protein [Gemmatimonadota bacterium]
MNDSSWRRKGWLFPAVFVALFGIQCTEGQIQQCIAFLQAIGISEQTSTNTCGGGAGLGEF